MHIRYHWMLKQIYIWKKPSRTKVELHNMYVIAFIPKTIKTTKKQKQNNKSEKKPITNFIIMARNILYKYM